jgi:hypothetical protein
VVTRNAPRPLSPSSWLKWILCAVFHRSPRSAGSYAVWLPDPLHPDVVTPTLNGTKPSIQIKHSALVVRLCFPPERSRLATYSQQRVHKAIILKFSPNHVHAGDGLE